MYPISTPSPAGGKKREGDEVEFTLAKAEAFYPTPFMIIPVKLI